VNETEAPSPRKRLQLGLGSGVVIGALAVVLLALLTSRSDSSMLGKLWSAIAGRRTTIISQGAVVERIQRLQRMETVVYNMDKIVTGQKDTPLLPDFLAGDKMMMIVHGQVVAGIDFDQLKSSDVQINGKEVRLKMPAPRVLFTRIDNARTRVYSRNTGLLVPTDPNLESQVRQQAEGELLDEAGRSGILNTARQNARSTLTSLLLGMGFEKVEIE
jgi:hypothetical protein